MEKNILKIGFIEDNEGYKLGVVTYLTNTENIDIIFVGDNMQELTEKLIKKCNIVIIGINNTDINGVDEILNFKKQYPDTKIIVLTEQYEPGNIKALYNTNVDAIVFKKNKLAEIVDAIVVVCKGGYYLSPEIRKHITNPNNTVNNKSKPDLTKLSKREKEILSFVLEGSTNEEIAEKLCLSVRTIQDHKTNIKNKLGFKNDICLFKYIRKNEVIIYNQSNVLINSCII